VVSRLQALPPPLLAPRAGADVVEVDEVLTHQREARLDVAGGERGVGLAESGHVRVLHARRR
jgi:hypothetical protein